MKDKIKIKAFGMRTNVLSVSGMIRLAVPVFFRISVHLWASVVPNSSIRGLRAAGGQGARDLSIGFWTAITIKLPRRTHFLDFV